jgi:RDD family
MDTGASHTDATADLPRAGFWRRWFATLIDSILVMLPFQILAAVLFSVTAGMVQMDSGFFRVCSAAETIPQSLDPPPPHDSNYAGVCRISFFGATTGAILTVGRVTREGSTTRTVSQGYMLDKDGKPIHGTSIDGIVWLALLAYLVGAIWKTGRTLGARVARVRVIDTTEPGVPGVRLHKAIIRYLAMAIGFVPVFAVLISRTAVAGGADAMFNEDFFGWFTYAAGLGLLWTVALIFQVSMKKDPVYDRLAGTAVVREDYSVEQQDLANKTRLSRMP